MMIMIILIFKFSINLITNFQLKKYNIKKIQYKNKIRNTYLKYKCIVNSLFKKLKVFFVYIYSDSILIFY